MTLQLLRLLMCGALFMSQAAIAVQQFTIGVFAFRDKAETVRKFQPLADYLEGALPGYRFRLQSYTYGELETAIERRQVDFVLSHAAHYVMMSERNALSSPLATLVERERNQPMPVYGGTIIVRADRADIARLADLKGKTVATSSTQGFASFQMQAYELFKIGLTIPGDVRVVQVDLPIDRSVMAVLEGKADAAFARMGLIEQMAQEGKLDRARVKVLNPQQLVGFDYAFSTTLYPMWPFVAMPQVPESLAARVAAALLMLPHDGEVARAAKIWGFTIPANYEPVKEVMQALRVPPFDEVPPFSWHDVWLRYTVTIVVALVAGAVILVLLFWLALSRRRLAVERNKVLESSLYARNLIEASPDPLLTISSEGRITDTNRAAEDITGIPRERLIGSDFSTHFNDREAAGAGYRRVFAEGLVRDLPLAICHVSGCVTEVVCNATVYRNPKGEIQGILASVRDMTELRRLEEELRNLNEHLEQRVYEEVAKNREKDHILIQQSRLAAMGEMVHNIAHQWRQPLSVLGLLLAEIQDAYAYNELNKESLEKAVSNGQRMIQKMSSTIDDFRNFFKPNKEAEPFSLGNAVVDAVKLIEPSLKGHDIAVNVEEGGEVEVSGFPNELSQVLLNILSNAKEASLDRRQGGARVDISWRSDSDNAWVVVRDNAGGIPDEILPKIFDPYFTTKAKGTGIGLYMSRMIMEHMNGRIEVANAADGAVFSIVCPLRQPKGES